MFLKNGSIIQGIIFWGMIFYGSFSTEATLNRALMDGPYSTGYLIFLYYFLLEHLYLIFIDKF